MEPRRPRRTLPRRSYTVAEYDLNRRPFLEYLRMWGKGSPPEDVKELREQLKSLNTQLTGLHHDLRRDTDTGPEGGGNPEGTSVWVEEGDSASLERLHSRASSVRSASAADIRNSYSASNCAMYAQISDLIHLAGPLTEDALIKTLQARFYSGHHLTNIGPIVVAVNPHTSVPGPWALSDVRRPRDADAAGGATPSETPLDHVVRSAVRAQLESGHSQAILLNGENGSGKTVTGLRLLRQLYDTAGGGPETDMFKHLRATLTVLRSMGSAATRNNPESSRMGMFIENHVSDGAIYKSRIHGYFLDQARITELQPREKNYHIFYQMLAGLTHEERVKYHLVGQSAESLLLLSRGDTTLDEAGDRARFDAWKNSLSVLGIPFSDIMRVLCSVLLLGNVRFVEGAGLELDVHGNNEIKAVSALLGISGVSLYRGCTTRTKSTRGQSFKALSDPVLANHTRDVLARSLYCRALSAVLKRANSCKRATPSSASGGGATDNSSNDSHETTSAPSGGAVSPGAGGGAAARDPSRDGFIALLDMFGFENAQVNQLEQLCMNLASETLQHFYTRHVFRTPQDACAEERIHNDVHAAYQDNAELIQLVSSQYTGILSLLDAECSLQHGNPEALYQRIHCQHRKNQHFFEPARSAAQSFGIEHFSSRRVVYDMHCFVTTNRDLLPDDVVSVFAKTSCTFGFATHLFSAELKAIAAAGGPTGTSFRISPSHTDVYGERSPLTGTLSQDFHTRLDGLLQTLVHCRPHFIRCIKSNSECHREMFERETVVQQIRSLQLLETVHLMAGGFPHRMRYKGFNSRYRLLVKGVSRSNRNHGNGEPPIEETKLVLDHFLRAMDESPLPYASAHWALGSKCIFLTEGARQQLELQRDAVRDTAATRVQTAWRRRVCERRWPALRRHLQRDAAQQRTSPAERKPAVRKNSLEEALENKCDLEKKCDQSTLQQTCSLYGLDMEQAPPVPKSRTYTVKGNVKQTFPQIRVMKQSYPEYTAAPHAPEAFLRRGQEIKVVGVSSKRGFLIVQLARGTMHVPFQLTELKTSENVLYPLERRRSSSTSHLPGIDV